MQSCVIYTFEEGGGGHKREKPICAGQDWRVIISGCYYCAEADVWRLCFWAVIEMQNNIRIDGHLCLFMKSISQLSLVSPPLILNDGLSRRSFILSPP